MKDQLRPVRDNEECERIIGGTYQGVLAMVAGDEPYVVPLNHAYRDGRFYFHCANSGQKLDAIAGNPNVTYVINKYYGGSAELAKALKCHGHWESVIARGEARIVSEDVELVADMKILHGLLRPQRLPARRRSAGPDPDDRGRRGAHDRSARVRRVQDRLLVLGAGGLSSPGTSRGGCRWRRDKR